MTPRDGRPPNLTGVPPRTGVAADDPRNQGVIGHFRPPEVDAAYLRDRLGASMPGASAEQVEARVGEVLARIAATPHRPPPPLSQPLEAAPDPEWRFLPRENEQACCRAAYEFAALPA